jgi:hypothetical protein
MKTSALPKPIGNAPHRDEVPVKAITNALAQLVNLFVRIDAKLSPQDSEISSNTCEKEGVKKRTFNRHAPNVTGAYRVGRVWFCSKSAWVAYHAAKTGAGSAGDDAYAQAVRKAGAR